MSFYKRYSGYNRFGLPVMNPAAVMPRVDNPGAVPAGAVVPAIAPRFPPVPLEVQTFMATSPQDFTKPAMFDPRTAQSFLPPQNIVPVSPLPAPAIETPKPTGQVMVFPSTPSSVVTKELPPDLAPSSPPRSRVDWSQGDAWAADEALQEVPVAWTPDGLIAAPASSKSPLLAAAAGAAGGFVLGGGPIGAAIGAALGYFVGKR